MIKKWIEYGKKNSLITSEKSCRSARSENVYGSYYIGLFKVGNLLSLVIKRYIQSTLWTEGVENKVKILRCFCVFRTVRERWHWLIFILFDMRHSCMSDGHNCVTKGQRHSMFLWRTVLSEKDTGVGKSLGWNKELFRASWLLLKVWMFASIEVPKPQVYFVSCWVAVAHQGVKDQMENASLP